MTRSVVRGLPAALLCVAMTTPAGAQDRDLREAKGRLARAGTWVGTVGNLDEEKTSFTLIVPITVPYWDARWIDRNWLRVRSGVYSVTEKVTVWLPDDTKVRVPHKPRFDDKGRPVRGTPAADPKDTDRHLGGTRGTPDDLENKQVVRVTLERNRAGTLFAKAVKILPDRP